jgi:spore germination protein GerM
MRRAVNSRRAIAGVLALLAVAGCGLRADERPEPIPRERLDDSLFEESSGEAAGAAAAATIYVLSTQGGRARLVGLSVPTRNSESRDWAVLEALLGWTPSTVPGTGQQLTSRIPSGTVLKHLRRENGVLVVDLADFPIAGLGQTQAAAQIVWTATALPGVRGVVFTIDGKTVALPLKERSSSPGDALDRDDFARLDLEPSPPGTAPAPSTTPAPTPSAPTSGAVSGAAPARAR